MNLPAASVAILDVALFFARSDGTFYIALGLILSKFYSNTTLAVLNYRMHIEGGRAPCLKEITELNLTVPTLEGSCGLAADHSSGLQVILPEQSNPPRGQ